MDCALRQNKLAELGHAIYGVPQWRAQMARDLSLSLPHLNRLVNGSSPITAKVRERVYGLALKRQGDVAEAVNDLFCDRISPAEFSLPLRCFPYAQS